ncbi:uncharacterized protein EV422DRAFT_414540 [Fimicolochytrium jonesii]|uniref:uncharacterized protein n=1 Tax=Fimicolochytrium jonesii TaxID=1396493 RepID=UPI0022FDE547|nr:uncharacterized protein EV422DRAFT_414540 [Fimicolochytrium jonesii]KAI8822045.1 hypothetical protein EV422DRAFT_414540 [Fimicolochytrium jonesii]
MMTTQLDPSESTTPPHGFASGFKPQSAPVSAANARLCHICGNTFAKASLPAHQRSCLRKSVRTGNRNSRTGSVYPSFAGGPEGQSFMMSCGKSGGGDSVARHRLSAPFSSPSRPAQPTAGRSSTATPTKQPFANRPEWASSPNFSGHPVHDDEERSYYSPTRHHRDDPHPSHYDEPFEDESPPHDRPIRRTAAAAAEYAPNRYGATPSGGSMHHNSNTPASASRFVPKKTIIAQHPASAHTRAARSSGGVHPNQNQNHAAHRAPQEGRYNTHSDEEWPASPGRKPVHQERFHDSPPPPPAVQEKAIGIPHATEDDDPNNFSWRDFAPLAREPVPAAPDVREQSNKGRQEWDDGAGDVDTRLPCLMCGRKFLEQDRLDKHMGACAKVKKPRKTYDATKARVKGTELEQYASKTRANSILDDRKGKAASHEDTLLKPRASNWRLKHDKFIQMVRAARQPLDRTNSTTSNNRSSSSLAPGTAAASSTDVDPDLVPCTHCGRRFQKDTAARHIPFCKESKQKAMYRANAMRPGQNAGGAGNGGNLPSREERMKMRTAYKPPLPKAKGSVVKASPARE